MRNIHLLFLLSFVLTLGCGSIPPTYYYRVNYSSETVNDPVEKLPFNVGLTQLRADALYATDKIVYRSSPYQAQFYYYRRWVAAPKKIVTEKILKHYRASNIFERVVRIPSTFKIDYILGGNIQAFEENDEGEEWFGVVEIEFTLQEASTQEVVWQQTFSERRKAAKKEAIEVVKAISESLDSVVNKSVLHLHTFLKKHSSN